MTTESANALLCPSCGSHKIWKNGLKYEVQTYLCRDCSRRFLDPKRKSVIKLNVLPQLRKELDSTPNFAEISISQSDSTVKKTLNDSSFSFLKM